MSELSPAAVEPQLRGAFGRPYRFEASCGSTQDLLLDPGLPEGAVAVADHQTAGRGRAGRPWEDVPGEALLVSVLLRPRRTPELSQLSLVAGHATALALAAATGAETALKWPNDVLLGDAKVAGILLEASGDAVVCGIGVNVAQPAERLPGGTSPPAGSLLTQTSRPHDRAALLVELLDELERAYDTWRASGLRPLRAELERRNWLRGRRVTVGGEPGLAGEIAPDGRLEVALDAGTLLAASGEVTLT